jgi:hypothetical protein
VTKRNATILLAAIGIVGLVVVVCVAAVAWFFIAVFDRGTTDEQTVTRELTGLRERFGGAAPVFVLDEDAEDMKVMREPPPGPAAELNTLHAIVWNPDESAVIRMELPFWLLRLKKGPIDVTTRAMVGATSRLRLTVADVERYGPAVLVDFEDRDGERLFVWTD